MSTICACNLLKHVSEVNLLDYVCSENVDGQRF